MFHIRMCNAIITTMVVICITSLTMVEKQPHVWIVTFISAFGALVVQGVKNDELMDIRSSAGEDRPE